MAKLKPCPYCGQKPEVRRSKWYPSYWEVRHRCEKDYYFNGGRKNSKGLIEIWNRRVEESIKTKYFEDIPIGSYFQYKNNFFLKTNNIVAFNLNTNKEFIAPSTLIEVIPKDGKVIIAERGVVKLCET